MSPIIDKSCVGCTHWYRDSPSISSVLRTRKYRDLPLCDICSEVIQTLQCLWDTYSAFKRSISDDALGLCAHEFQGLVMKGKMDSAVSYRGAALFSWFMRQPMPACPDFLVLDGKPLFHFPGLYQLDSVIRNSKDNDRRKAFVNSLLYLKRGMPRADEEKLEAKTWDTFHALTRRHRASSLAEHLEHGMWRELVKRRLPAIVNEIYRPFSNLSWWSEVDMIPKIPSRNSHFCYPRRTFGALESCYHGYLEAGNREHMMCPGEQKSDHFYDEKNVLTGRQFNLQQVEWIHPNFLIRDQDAIIPEVPLLLDRLTRRIRFGDWLIDRRIGRLQIPFAELHSLAEPCKIRTISKGQDHLYSALSIIQKMMFDGLSRFKQFLCWRPVDSCILSSVLHDPLTGEFFVSGDYKAATNNINPELTRFTMNLIARATDMPDDLVDLCHKALTDHEVCFGGPFSYDGSRKGWRMPGFCSAEQKWGQLMGSPISFPILCLINFAAISVAIHEPVYVLGRRVCTIPRSVRDERIIVNGDDCVFVANERERLRWERCTAACGLELSVGKTYYSPEWLIINSTMYTLRINKPIPCVSSLQCVDSVADDHRCRFNPIGFLNLSLMFGLKRAGSDDYDPTDVCKDPMRDGTIGSRLEKLTSNLPSDVADYAYSAFIADHRSRLPNNQIPWFVPEWLGGFGLPPRPSLGFDADTRDYEIASASILRPDIWEPVRIFSSAPGSSKTFPQINRWLEHCGLRKGFSIEPSPSLEQAFYRDGLFVSLQEMLFVQELRKHEQDDAVLRFYYECIKRANSRQRDLVKDYAIISAFRQQGVIPSSHEELRSFVWNAPPVHERYDFDYHHV